MSNPLSRRSGLLTHSLGDKLVVYDQERRRLHTLNQTAALIWRHCDGERTVDDITTLVGDALGITPDETMINLALAQLQEAHLLTERPAAQTVSGGTSRRDLLKWAAAATAGALLPAVTSIGSPSTVEAQRRSTGSMPGDDSGFRVDALPVQPGLIQACLYGGSLSQAREVAWGDIPPSLACGRGQEVFFSQGYDYHACLHAGSMSQFSSSTPVSCGRGDEVGIAAGTTLWACLYAGSLSQVGFSEAASCGRGERIGLTLSDPNQTTTPPPTTTTTTTTPPPTTTTTTTTPPPTTTTTTPQPTTTFPP